MFNFANPSFLYLLLCIPVLSILYIISIQRKKKNIDKLGNKRLISNLIYKGSTKLPHIKFSILLFSLFLMIIMLARPRLGIGKNTIKKSGIQVSFMIDVSNSMLAQDISPNRLERTKSFLENLIQKMPQDKISMGIFAGDAYPILPMTSDLGSSNIYINNISTDNVSKQGTNIAAAIQLGEKSFINSTENSGKALIIITDGEDHMGGAETAAKDIKKKGIKLFIIGIGTTQGSYIPISTNYNETNNDNYTLYDSLDNKTTSQTYITDASGKKVLSKLNENMCKKLAALGNGDYFHLSNTNTAHEDLLSALNQLQKSTSQISYADYNEQFQAFGLLAFIFLLANFFIFQTEHKWFKSDKKNN